MGLKVGVIGMGKMGILHSAIINSISGARIEAVAETEKFVSGFLSNLLRFDVYNDYKKMLEHSALDAVYITTPVISHVPIASHCAERGIPFFLEKPIGKNSEECKTLCDIVKEKNVLSMVGFYLRYAETFSKAKTLLESKTIGEIIKIKSSVYQSQFLNKASGWRFKKEISGGGVLIDLGSHLIDLLLWYFGNIKKVEGNIESYYSQEVEDTVRSTIFFENDVDCFFEASWNVKGYRLQETTIEVEGTIGKLKVNEDYVKISYNEPNNERQDGIFYRQSLYSGVPIDIGGPEYTREDQDFLKCVRIKKQPMLNVIDSSKTQSVIDSIYKSSRNKNAEVVIYIE